MSEQVFGLTASGIARTAETNRRVLGELPDTGRRTRRVFPQGGGGGRGGKIWFDVISIGYYNGWVLPGCESVLAVVTQVSCETTSVAVGDEVYVYDPSFCFFNLPIVILMNLSGTATLSKRDDLTFTRCGVYMTDECFWAVDGVCCLEEDYGT